MRDEKSIGQSVGFGVLGLASGAGEPGSGVWGLGSGMKWLRVEIDSEFGEGRVNHFVPRGF